MKYALLNIESRIKNIKIHLKAIMDEIDDSLLKVNKALKDIEDKEKIIALKKDYLSKVRFAYGKRKEKK